MASGKSLELQWFTRKRIVPRETYPRDRSLRGKARVKARKAANKA